MAEWNVNNSMGDSLEHHGILGMHWGIRRFQPYPKGYRGNGREVGDAAKSNREINKIWDQEIKKEKEAIKAKRKEINAKANKIAEKHEYFFDAKKSETDRKAAEQFNKLMDQYAILTRGQRKESAKKARETMVKRFGETRISEVAKSNRVKEKIGYAIAGTLGAITLLSVRNNLNSHFQYELMKAVMS